MQLLRMAGLALLGVLLPCMAAAGQDMEKDDPYLLESVTVTADKQEKSVQDIAGSISVTTGMQMEDYGISETSELFQRTPNMYLINMGPKSTRTNFVSMRGIAGYMSGNPPIGFYVDDVYYSGFGINFFDIERIEVLRGPQGTLYGRNTEAGVINVVTRKPEEEWKTKIGLGGANYNTKQASLTTGGALVDDTLYLRAAGSYLSSDGYFTNMANDSDDADKHQEIDGRASLRWTPTSKWDVTLTTDYQHYESNYAEFATLEQIKDNPHHVNVDYEGDARKIAIGSALRASYEMENMKLLSVTAYRAEDYIADNDVDFTTADIMRLNLDNSITTASQEFRLYSTDRESAFQWLAGAYFFHEDDDQDMLSDMRAMGVALNQSGRTEGTGAALFGQGTYTLWDRLDLTAGLRYDRENKDFDYQWSGGSGIGVPDQSGSTSKLFQAWLPKFAASYHFTDDFTTYLSASRGFKSGGFNIKATPGVPFNSEFTWSYEAGIKSGWLDNRLELNMAAFVIKWDDMQVELPEYPDYTVVNAGKATSKGFEAELKARPVRGLEIVGALGFTHATFDEFVRNGRDLEGNRVPNVPGFSGQLGCTYRFDNGLFLGADYMRTGSMYYDAENTRKQGAYQIINAKLGFEDENYEVYLWGKNLFNAVYATRGFTMNNTWYGRAGDPLTFGLSGAVRF